MDAPRSDGRSQGASAGPLPHDLTCPICFDLFDDPVCWPAPNCLDRHNFCRQCIVKLCMSENVSELCPVCRAPAVAPVLDQLWTLPVDNALNERLEREYPDKFAASVTARQERQRAHEALPRVVMPIVASLLCGPSHKMRRGKRIDLSLTTPEHLVSLAAALANVKAHQRFGVLMQGQTWGYVAGIVSPRLVPIQKKHHPCMKEILAQLRFSGRIGKGPLKLTILLVDTFRLDAEPREETIDRGVGLLVGSPNVAPIRFGTLITSPLGDVKAFETC